MPKNSELLARILWRILQDKLAIEGAKMNCPETLAALSDCEKDIYTII